VLAPFPLATVRQALDEHVRTSRFPPTPAEILELIGGNDGRPGAEEAWALALRDRDERLTVVWTKEMRVAWSAARPVLIGGDEVGARMAFREAYNREVESARRRCEPVHWDLSIGQDSALAAESIRVAVADGRLKLPPLGAPGDEPTRLLADATAPVRAALPAPEPGDSELARRGKAAMAAVAERLRNPVAASVDEEQKLATAAAAAESAKRAMAYAEQHGIPLAANTGAHVA